MPKYKVVASAPESDEGFVCYGAMADFWKSKHFEVCLSGGYETGKTYTALNKLHALMIKYPEARALMVRKTYSDLVQSAIVTYTQKILTQNPIFNKNSPIKVYGGSKPEFFTYPNGSQIIVAGLDSGNKVLSAEYDFIYVNQMEELSLDDYEKLVPRASGRSGNTPYTQVMGEANPDVPSHWIPNRDQLLKFYVKHEDNPRLFDPHTKEWTEQGKKTISILDSLTGLRYKRGRLGLWVGAEGQVYDSYDPSIHLISRSKLPEGKIPDSWRKIRCIDFGYTNPFACLWLAADHDGRVYVYRQIYKTKTLVEEHATRINQLSQGEKYECTIADHADAEGRATLAKYGIFTYSANKDIKIGIQNVQSYLQIQGDGRPRLYIVEGSLDEIDPELKAKHYPLSLKDEFGEYVWKENDKARSVKEEPVDNFNHALDALRYGLSYFKTSTIRGHPENPFYS